MAIRSKKACRHPGCPALVDVAGYCEKHEKQTRKQVDEKRGNAASRGYGRPWQRARAGHLRNHPLCESCKRGATLVDHIKPHKGDQDLFWDTSNWQSLCGPCHSAKTAKEDGRWG